MEFKLTIEQGRELSGALSQIGYGARQSPVQFNYLKEHATVTLADLVLFLGDNGDRIKEMLANGSKAESDLRDLRSKATAFGAFLKDAMEGNLCTEVSA